MIEYKIAEQEDIDLLMSSRLEMLKVVNDLPDSYEFNDEMVKYCRDYFVKGNQTTVLAIDGKVIGCATLSYIDIMPTFSHPTGKRAHLMNVYTNSSYRRQGIAMHMLNILFEEAKQKGVTEISLDATESGRPLYEKCGFTGSEECMVMCL
jgi:ribosomal protein S18 acetylase RimI-like enzyme